jgi:hypothetical protein
MKTMEIKILAALAAAVLIPALDTRAQYKPTGDDGVTASPKVRKTLDERRLMAQAASMPVVTVDLAHPQGDGIAASPKARAQMAAHAVWAGVAPGNEPSTTRAPNDGLVASPKAREILRGGPARPTVELAPISR